LELIKFICGKKYQDLDKIKEEFEREEKEQFEKARRISVSVIPSINDDS
jgi:hypothetical protein